MVRWTARDMPDQTGRLVAVTGATGGLGFETALALARAGAEVVMLGRNTEKGAAAIDRIHREAPGARLAFQRLDLSSLASVRAGAKALLDEGRPLDLLINNAGVMALPTRQVSADGFELQFATNVLGHVLLTAALLPLLRQGKSPRVVTVSSLMHRVGRIDFDDLQGERRYDPQGAYAQSKLADLLFARELQKRSAAGGWGVASLAAHPGVSQSELIVNGMGRATVQGRLAARMTSLIWQPTARGALPSLFAATAPDAIPGGYYGPDGVMEIGGAPAPAHVSRAGRDAAAAKRLWEACTALTGAVWPASSGEPSPDRTPT